jgi:hypothetical protein
MMKRLLLAVLLAALPLCAQDKRSLELTISPAPSGAVGGIPYAINSTTIGWIAHATGLQCLTQNGTAPPAFGACGGGSGTVTSITATAPLTGGTITGSGSIGCATMVASGGSHAAGCVGDPGASAGSTKYWREDATFAVPAGGGGGTLTTLKETVFAGITPASYATGTTTTIDGSGYTCTIAGGGTVEIVAAGLRITRGTTAGTLYNTFQITHGNTGDLLSIVGEARFRRGHWGFWIHRASWDYTNASGAVLGLAGGRVSPAKWGFDLSRSKNVNGAPNTATAGNAFEWYGAGAASGVSTYPGASSDDVMLAYFRSPTQIDFYSGAWSSGWPLMENMTLEGSAFIGPYSLASWIGSTYGPPTAGLIDILFLAGNAAATSGTYEIVFDRFRITTWE